MIIETNNNDNRTNLKITELMTELDLLSLLRLNLLTTELMTDIYNIKELIQY